LEEDNEITKENKVKSEQMVGFPKGGFGSFCWIASRVLSSRRCCKKNQGRQKTQDGKEEKEKAG